MYYIVYGTLYLVSLIPLKLLYLAGDGIYALLYYLVRYRRDVVEKNLALAFPEKTSEERKKIEKKFYRNFVDNFIETLKIISGGTKFVRKHFLIDNTLLERQFLAGKKCQFHLGHNFNWELANIATAAATSYEMLVVYMPVKNRIFERLMLKLRSAAGSSLLPATDMRRAMMPFRTSQYLLALVADQAPGDPSKAYWLNFFGRPTPFMKGPERGAVAGNLSVFFAQFYKLKRGVYKMDYELYAHEAGSLPKGELTRRYVEYLEKVIRQHPEMWLWSHRRWKAEWKNEYASSWIDTAPLPVST